MSEGANQSIDISRCRKLVELEKKKALLERDLKRTVKEIQSLWKPIIEDLVSCGVRSVPLDDGSVLYKRRDIFLNKKGGVPTEQACAAIIRADLEWMIRQGYSTQDLKAWIKEREEEMLERGEVPGDVQELLPDSLKGVFSIHERDSIVIQRLPVEINEAEEESQKTTE